ncbi:MAG: hemin uptake protein HemP [Hyphomicrobiaceae bacterium]|nr:hemin uptake protein HemP [Hyphomicrobiaceae bacterium]
MSDDEDASVPVADTPKHLTTEQLFAGARELTIEHNGEIYRLRITAKGGLLLTK